MTTEGRGGTIRGPSRFEALLGLRYIWSRSGNRFISFISLISMLGIAIGVAVLVVVGVVFLSQQARNRRDAKRLAAT